ncbi:MAG: radical SAM protein [Capsulimonadaceae bacterium]|nr:radical SAM protein [Capsulimonadaceae bacterium]
MASEPNSFSMHPCFDPQARHLYGRIHLPVAPKCNIQCNYCNRKFDCATESRPGVTSALLRPAQAADYLDAALKVMPQIAVVGIAGPGDPFANPRETIETLRLVKERHPDMLLCVSSNGLAIEQHLDELVDVGISHVTLTINAIDPEIGAKIYGWVRDGKEILRGRAAAERLLERQMSALKALAARGVVTKVNSIILPGINDRHIPDIARVTGEMGADLMNCLGLIPVEGTPFGELTEPDGGMVARVRLQAREHIKIMAHCSRCRADAAGLLGETPNAAVDALVAEFAQKPAGAKADRPYVAVASHEGLLVNKHLGEADEFLIFAQQGDGYECVGRRPAPPKGGGERRWKALADCLSDCRAVLVSAVGQTPREVLGESGVHVFDMAGMIQDGLDVIFRDADPSGLKRRSGKACPGGGANGGCG